LRDVDYLAERDDAHLLLEDHRVSVGGPQHGVRGLAPKPIVIRAQVSEVHDGGHVRFVLVEPIERGLELGSAATLGGEHDLITLFEGRPGVHRFVNVNDGELIDRALIKRGLHLGATLLQGDVID
jgi:hypothetical protein